MNKKVEWCVCVRTTMNILDDQINHAQILFSRVGCFLIIVFLGTILHISYFQNNLIKLQTHIWHKDLKHSSIWTLWDKMKI